MSTMSQRTNEHSVSQCSVTQEQRRDPEPGCASLSGRTAIAVEGDGVTTLQLNVEGLTSAKMNIIEQLAVTNKAIVILLQETHQKCDEKLVLPNYLLAGYIRSQQHGLATFIRQDIDWSLEAQSPPDSPTEWLAVKVLGVNIINVYKPPPVRLTNSSLPSYAAPCLYAGDFNCQHTDWGYSRCSNDGNCLAEWASTNNLTLLFNPKEPDSFSSARWNTGTNPDLAFAEPQQGHQLPVRRVLDKFPRSQHRPSLITQPALVSPTASKPVMRWNFRKARWDRFLTEVDKHVPGLPSPESEDINATYSAYCDMLIDAAKQSIPRGYQKNYIPCWDDECQSLYEDFTSAPSKDESDTCATTLLSRLDEKRKERWIETVESIDFTYSSRRAWQTVNRLTGRSKPNSGKCPVTANSIASVLVDNGRFPQPDREHSRQVKREVSELWKIDSTMDLCSDFTAEEIEAALSLLKPGKAPGPDSIHPEFLHHAGTAATNWLCKFLSSCMKRCKIPKIWRKATVIALPKPNKPKDDPKSYRPISLLCIPYKLLERLIHSRINPIIDPQLPHEQAGFRRGRSTVDQVTLLTQDIEDCFEGNQKAGVVLVDLTAAYDTVWHRGLIYKLLKLIPDRRMVSFIVQLISNRNFILKTSDGQTSRPRSLRNGVPQGSVLAPLLFNVYIHDLPDTISKKYGYADDLAILKSSKSWDTIESALSQDMGTLDTYLHQWRLKLSVGKTVSSAFHLNNKEAKRELNVTINSKRLNYQACPTYLGVKLDRTLTYRQHLTSLRDKVTARCALIRHLAGTSWGASVKTLRTSTLALVYAPAEYCAPVWSRSRHTSLVDTSLNDAMRTVTGCLRPTPTEQLPVLAGIPPPDIRRKATTLAITLKSEEKEHLLHETVARARSQHGESRRLKSRMPFSQQVVELTETMQPDQIVKDWIAKEWKAQWHKTTSPLKRFIQDPTATIPGCNLPRSAWSKLNRLRSGVGRFNANLYRWGLAESPACDCGSEEQSADHVITDCPLYGSPSGIPGLTEMDEATTEWLLHSRLDI